MLNDNITYRKQNVTLGSRLKGLIHVRKAEQQLFSNPSHHVGIRRGGGAGVVALALAASGIFGVVGKESLPRAVPRSSFPKKKHCSKESDDDVAAWSRHANNLSSCSLNSCSLPRPLSKSSTLSLICERGIRVCAAEQLGASFLMPIMAMRACSCVSYDVGTALRAEFIICRDAATTAAATTSFSAAVISAPATIVVVVTTTTAATIPSGRLRLVLGTANCDCAPSRPSRLRPSLKLRDDGSSLKMR